MQQFIEFAGNHPFLVSGAVLMVLLVAIYEIRARTQSFGSISASETVRLMNHGGVLIDIRKKEDFDAAHIVGARHVPGATIADGAKGLEKWKEKPIIAYCDTGMTAGSAARHLTRLGFKQAYNLRGGLAGWRQENLPVTKS